MRTMLLVLLVVSLAACSSGPYPITSPYYVIPAGSQLVVKQELTIEPNAGRVYIQNGKVVTPKEKNQYYPHCWFLSWVVTDAAQTIKPDTFFITATRKNEDIVQSTSTKYLAAATAISGVFGAGGGRPTAIEYSTELTIHSEKQPDIRRLVCSYWENPEDARHLTVADMQKTLGEIAEIKISP